MNNIPRRRPVPRREGWAVPPHALRQHYFVGLVSLCRKHVDSGGEMTEEQFGYISPCATCYRKRDRTIDAARAAEEPKR